MTSEQERWADIRAQAELERLTLLDTVDDWPVLDAIARAGTLLGIEAGPTRELIRQARTQRFTWQLIAEALGTPDQQSVAALRARHSYDSRRGRDSDLDRTIDGIRPS